jgi:hypothetical protein
MRRVHIVDVPLSRYIRFEVECCYRLSEGAGEQIRLLDRALIPSTLRETAMEDYWLFDRSTVMVNDYDSNGTLSQARVTEDSRAVGYYANLEEQVWELSVPFRRFYKTHTGLEL